MNTEDTLQKKQLKVATSRKDRKGLEPSPKILEKMNQIAIVALGKNELPTKEAKLYVT